MNKFEKMFTKRSTGLYQASYTKDGKRHYLYDRDAHRLFNRLADATNGTPSTVSDLAASWESVHSGEIGERTWKNYKPHLAGILDRHGKELITSVTPLMIIGDLELAQARKYSRTICRTILSIWSMMMSHAVVKGIITHNPAMEVKLPKGLPHGKRTSPDDKTIRSIFRNADHEFGLFPLLLVTTGMRKSEALALTWEDIDLEAGVIHVTKALEYPTDRPRLKSPKTEAGVRDVPIPDILREHLHPGTGIVFPQKPYNGHPGGGYMGKRPYETAWKKYCEETGISCTAHQLRHATATLLYEAGVDEKIAQQILGHASPQTTRDIYTDLRDAHLKAGAEALNKALTMYAVHQ